MDRFIERFTRYLEIEKNYSAHTVLNYRLDLGDFIKFLGDTQIENVDYLLLRKYLALLKEKKDAKEKISSMKDISRRISELEDQIKEKDSQLNSLLINIPNIAHESLPVGDASCNKIVRTWGEPKKPNFKPLTHIEICQNLDIIDFNRATKITGSNFVLFKGWGAKLERALINFMLDFHVNDGFVEINPPQLVNAKTMFGTGQLPKFEDDLYKTREGLYNRGIRDSTPLAFYFGKQISAD